MKERPILFSAPMINAILGGSKTMTRRIVEPQPNGDGLSIDSEPIEYGRAWRGSDGSIRSCPYGVPGDRLWVRETFYCDDAFAGKYLDVGAVSGPRTRQQQEAEWREALYYRADGEPKFEAPDGPTPWSPSIHMPRWASRIDLEVTAVCVERLQDITEKDVWAEGIEAVDGVLSDAEIAAAAKANGWTIEDARASFAVLWDKINGGKAPWKSKPWAWVVSFKRVRP